MNILFENEIAIVACLKNESPYVEEWLEYHHAIGIDKFYLYDNDSEDRSELLKILASWIEREIVEYVEFPGTLAQISAYFDALNKHRFDCKYLAFLDLDEFIVPKKNQNLLDVINSIFAMKINPRFEIGGVGINWRVFGMNGQSRKLSGGVIERFTHRAPDEFKMNLHIKTICNPRRTSHLYFPHNVRYYDSNICINERGEYVAEFSNMTNSVDKIQINHYYTKSQEEFFEKLSRGRADTPQPYTKDDWSKNITPDTVEDTTAIEIFNKSKRGSQLRNKKLYGDIYTINDIEQMLTNSHQDMESLLTCFHRANGISYSDDRESLKDAIIEQILQLNQIKIRDAQLFIDTLPNLLNTRYKQDIAKNGVALLNSLKQIHRQNRAYDAYFALYRQCELLKLFL